MKIVFDEIEKTVIPNFKGGEKEFSTHMFTDSMCKIMRGTLEKGASIGLHTHETSSEMIFILEGEGTVLYDGETEILPKGSCHYCPKGHTHSLMNKNDAPLVFFAVVPEQS